MQMEYCESQDSRRYEVTQSRSPGSPDRQYCSSTTQPLGDSMLGHAEVSLKLSIMNELLARFQLGNCD
jgi:estrogen-related receptor ERR